MSSLPERTCAHTCSREETAMVSGGVTGEGRIWSSENNKWTVVTRFTIERLNPWRHVIGQRSYTLCEAITYYIADPCVYGRAERWKCRLRTFLRQLSRTCYMFWFPARLIRYQQETNTSDNPGVVWNIHATKSPVRTGFCFSFLLIPTYPFF